MREIFFTAVMLFTAVGAFGQVSYEKILLPTIIDAPGQHGAIWRSDLLSFNSSGSQVPLLAPLPCSGIGSCGFMSALSAGEVERLFPIALSPDRPGLLIYIPSQNSGDVTFHLRVSDFSRDTQSRGTEVPVVRERDLLTGTIELFDVPMDPLFRDNLRIYAVDGPATVHVRYFSAGILVDQLLSEGDLPLDADTTDQFDPGYVGVNDLQNNPALNDPALNVASLLRIEITPVTPGLRYWAFVSITNNDTQQITLVTP